MVSKADYAADSLLGEPKDKGQSRPMPEVEAPVDNVAQTLMVDKTILGDNKVGDTVELTVSATVVDDGDPMKLEIDNIESNTQPDMSEEEAGNNGELPL